MSVGLGPLGTDGLAQRIVFKSEEKASVRAKKRSIPERGEEANGIRVSAAVIGRVFDRRAPRKPFPKTARRWKIVSRKVVVWRAKKRVPKRKKGRGPFGPKKKIDPIPDRKGEESKSSSPLWTTTISRKGSYRIKRGKRGTRVTKPRSV